MCCLFKPFATIRKKFRSTKSRRLSQNYSAPLLSESFDNDRKILAVDENGRIEEMSKAKSRDRTNLPPFVAKATIKATKKSGRNTAAENYPRKQKNAEKLVCPSSPNVVYIALNNGTIYARTLERTQNGYDLSAIIFSDDDDFFND
jgi:hypothetical protein